MTKIRFHPYIVLNLCFIGVILLIFLYSGILSAQKDNHPIPSYYEVFTGKKSPASGLSRSFSEIIRGDFPEARKWNENGIPLFIFFFVQFFIRILTTILIVKRVVKLTILVCTDAVFSVILFLYCYQNLIFIWKFF